MKFSASVAVSSTSTASVVLISFLFCAALTIKGASCTTNTTTTQLQESSNDDGNRTTTASTKTSPNNATTTEQPVTQHNTTALKSNTKRTCACDDTEESLICASNGITYKNTCRFECAKARVNRLRQVKQGRCSQAAGAQTYWQSQKSG